MASGLIALALIGTVLGCAGGKVLGRRQFVAFTPEQRTSFQSGLTAPYRLQRGDVFSVDFFYNDQLDQDQVLVLPDGSVNMIGIDSVPAAGLTLAELDSTLTMLYGRDYLDPALTVIVREIEPRKLYVLGEVERPGLHEIPTGGIDVLSAIAVAGGFTPDAARGGTVLVRASPEGYLCQELDLGSFHQGSAAELGIFSLQAYDVLYVPRSGIAQVNLFMQQYVRDALPIQFSLYYDLNPNGRR